TPVPAEPEESGKEPPRHALSRDLGLLYRLALDMGGSGSLQELNRLVLDALLEATPADTGAILTVKDGGDLELVAHRNRDADDRSYMQVSKFVSNEVLSTREAIWAEDLSTEQQLRDRHSLTEFGATSLICAPVAMGEKVLGLIHLYCLGGNKAFASDDLEFALA